MATKHWTRYQLTDSMLKAMAAMHNRQRHRYGTMLEALRQRRGPLIRERIPRCPDCGIELQAEVKRSRDYDMPQDRITCARGHTDRRDRWGGCYGFTYELTEEGRQALAAARQEGW